MPARAMNDFAPCDARGCDNPADLAYIGEGGDLYLCDFHGGAGEVEGWTRIPESTTDRPSAAPGADPPPGP